MNPHALFALPLAALVMTGAAAAAEPALQWSASRDIAGESDGGLIVVPDGAGGVYMLGATPLFAGGEDIVIIRYDAAGAEQWMTIYAGDGDGYQMPADAVVDAAGDLYVITQTTFAQQALSSEWATIKLSGADGSLLWDRRFSGSGTFGQPIPRDMAIGPDGRIAVTGWVPSDSSWVDFGVAVYAPDGTELWTHQTSSPGSQPDSAEGVAVGPDASVVVVGQWALPGNRIIGVVKYSAAGAVQWTRTFDASAVSNLEDRVHAVAIESDGSIYVAADGIDHFTDGRDFVLLKYAADGTLLWDRRVIEPTADISPSISLAADGTVYLSGSSDGDHRVVAFSPAGEQLWTVQRDGAISSDAARRHMAIDAQGQLSLLVRTVPTPGVSAFTAVRYAPDGSSTETIVDPLGTGRWPTGFAADTLGNFFATGWWINHDNRDMLVYKLALEPGATADITGDGAVNVDDLVAVITAWGTCPPAPATCAADINGDGVVNVDDLVAVIVQWS